MKVEFYRPASAPGVDQPDAEAPPPELVGSASWVDAESVVECRDDELRTLLERAYRKTPVVTDDASYRRFGTHGEVQIQPGTLEWFRAASFVRVPAEAGRRGPPRSRRHGGRVRPGRGLPAVRGLDRAARHRSVA